MPSNDVITLHGVTKTYRLGRIRVCALADVTLTIARGDFIALAGPSGSGKTTLLNLIGCIDKPDSGRIVVDDADVTPIPLHRLATLRRNTLGFIFQTFNLIPVLTAYENVEYPLLLQNVPRRERDARVRRWLAEVGIEQQWKQRPDQLSGGQRQRVAIARAMVTEPKLVLADEPTANLDSDTATHILDLLGEINARTGCTFVFSTHDPSLIARVGSVVRIKDGRIAPVIPSREEGEGPATQTHYPHVATAASLSSQPGMTAAAGA
jgi:putative ABC transport system ATP-binding protein